MRCSCCGAQGKCWGVGGKMIITIESQAGESLLETLEEVYTKFVLGNPKSLVYLKHNDTIFRVDEKGVAQANNLGAHRERRWERQVVPVWKLIV
jgi:hypothetical protein